MRAIIRCDANIEPEGLDAFLMSRNWWPTLPQDHPEVLKRREEILNTVVAEDRALVENTLLYTIYNEGSKTWGIVNKPGKHSITFRLKNPVALRLQSAAIKLVRDLQTTEGKPGVDQPLRFTFTAPVEVLEPNGNDHAYYGEILTSQRFRLVIEKRRIEAFVGLCAATVAVGLTIMTAPSVARVVFSGADPEWIAWMRGFVERLASSAIVTATVTYLNLGLYWLEIRRQPAIKWSFS